MFWFIPNRTLTQNVKVVIYSLLSVKNATASERVWFLQLGNRSMVNWPISQNFMILKFLWIRSLMIILLCRLQKMYQKERNQKWDRLMITVTGCRNVGIKSLHGIAVGVTIGLAMTMVYMFRNTPGSDIYVSVKAKVTRLDSTDLLIVNPHTVGIRSEFSCLFASIHRESWNWRRSNFWPSWNFFLTSKYFPNPFHPYVNSVLLNFQ